MAEDRKKIKIDGVWFVLWTAIFGCLVALTVKMVRADWHFGVTGVCCFGLLFALTGYMLVRYGYRLWTVYDNWRTERLRAYYRQKYLPHAQNELYLRKAYSDAVAFAATLYPFYWGRVAEIRSDILYEMLEQLESIDDGVDDE